jgi:hypothetical protein
VQTLLSSNLRSKYLKIKIFRTTKLPVVLYWCETWSLTLREELRLRVFENRVLGRIFLLKRDEVTGKWRKLHNEVSAAWSRVSSEHTVWGGRSILRIWGEKICSQRIGPGKPETTCETYCDVWKNNVTVGLNIM